jgi:hypothetical protein
MDDDFEDWLIQSYVDAATSWIDAFDGVLGRCVMPQTWQITEQDVLCGMVLPDEVSRTVNEDGTADVTCAIDAACLPQIRQAVMMLASYWLDQRMAATEKSWSDAPMAVRALLAPIRRM